MTMNFLNLPNWEVAGVKESKHDYRVEATYAVLPERCPFCPVDLVSGRLYRHGTTTSEVMDLPSHGKRVGISLKRVRMRCQDCGKTVVQGIPHIDDRGTMTKRLVAWIERQSLSKTFTSVAEEVGITEGTVRNIFHAHVAYLEGATTFETPGHLGIDEIHLIRKPRAVFTNLKARTIIGVLPDRLKKNVKKHLQTLNTATVKVVAIDMHRAYRDAAREVFPDAGIVVDKFHVVRMANQCLEAVRKSFRESLQPKERRKLMHDRFVLLKRNRDLTDTQRETMAGWVKVFPKIGDAYRIKECFFALWDAPDLQSATALLHDWELSITDAEMLTAFRPLLTALQNWRPEILAYFTHNETNAVTESLNGIARHIERNGRGYSFDVIRAKMLWGTKVQKRPAYNPDICEYPSEPRPYPELTGNTLGSDVDLLLTQLSAEAGNPTVAGDSSDAQE